MSISKIGFVSEKRCPISKRVETKDTCLIGMYPMDWSTPYTNQLSGRGVGAYPNDTRFDWKDWVCAPKMGKLIPCVHIVMYLSQS